MVAVVCIGPGVSPFERLPPVISGWPKVPLRCIEISVFSQCRTAKMGKKLSSVEEPPARKPGGPAWRSGLRPLWDARRSRLFRPLYRTFVSRIRSSHPAPGIRDGVCSNFCTPEVDRLVGANEIVRHISASSITLSNSPNARVTSDEPEQGAVPAYG